MIKLKELLNESVSKLNQIGKRVAQKVNCDVKGSCVGFAELFVIDAYKTNPDLLKDFDVIEGYAIEGGRRFQHTWIRTKDGKDIDPTFAQFKPDSDYDTKVKRKYSGEQYFKDTVRIHRLDINKIDTSKMTIGKWYK